METAKQNELAETLNPAFNMASQMILAGTLKKNVIRHFTNIGFNYASAENITEVGTFRAEQLMKNKAN